MTGERFQRGAEQHNWALVLAGGEGTRLQSLTRTASGVCVPKQFCSLGAGPSLLHAALQRARAVAPAGRTCVVVAEHHRRWWQKLDLDLPRDNVVSQPFSRGTAHGILLPLLQILQRDPDATVLILPADHHVRNEPALARSLQQSMRLAGRHGRIVLLGIRPEEVDPELGYIVPDGESDAGLRRVSRFIEKPSMAAARMLISCGAVWNAFIIAAQGEALLRMFESSCGDTVASLRCIIEQSPDPVQRQRRISGLYEQLPGLDFSRDILQKHSDDLWMLTAPPCGWSDLGTPRRVAEAVMRKAAGHDPSGAIARARGFLDLAARHAQLQVAD